MNKREVKDIIYEGLKVALSARGFRLKKSEGKFVRPMAGGKQTLWVPFWDRNPHFEFSLSMTFRLDAVEEITNRFSAAPPKYHSMTETVLTQLEHLGVERRRWQAQSEAELSVALDEMRDVISRRILPFFDRYQDLQTIAEAANPQVAPVIPAAPNGMTTGQSLLADRVLFHSGNHPSRAMSAITLAHLAGLSHSEALVQRYEIELRPIERERGVFDQLVEYLRNRKT